MELKINITLGQTITVVLLMCVAFAGGFLINFSQEQVVNEYTGFTEKDLNILGQLTYMGGDCERLGLVTTVLPQMTDKNEVYGIPICIEIQGGGVQ